MTRFLKTTKGSISERFIIRAELLPTGERQVYFTDGSGSAPDRAICKTAAWLDFIGEGMPY